MGNILVIGSANTDMVVKVAHLPATGETIIGGNFHKLPGGKGANQAVAAKRASGDLNDVTFITSVGNDDLGKEAVCGYQKDHINTSHIEFVDNVPTGVALITVDDVGNNTISVASGANMHLSADHIKQKQALIHKADVVLLQLEVDIETVTTAVQIAFENNQQSKNGIKQTVMLNPAPAQALPTSLLEKVDILTPNETEAEILTGIKVTDEATSLKAANRLLSFGVKQVMITLGKNGVFYANSQTNKHFPSFNVNAIDSTAAGDSFNGALAAAISQKQPIDKAIHFAQAAAALSVTQLGAQSAIPCLCDIKQFIKH